MTTPTGMATVKAVIMVDPTYAEYLLGPPVIPAMPCLLNPTSLTISGGSDWQQEQKTDETKSAPESYFAKQKPRTLSTKLMFDQFGLPAGDVSTMLMALDSWCTPRKNAMGKAAAAFIRLQWGPAMYFVGYLETYTINYTLFSMAGPPLRAEVDITIKEKNSVFPGTNPTSGGLGGEKFHVTVAGDSLHSLAHKYYGKAALWRGLAAFNGIDDPMRLGPGVAVALPSAAALESLS